NNRERYLASDNLIRQMLQTNGIGLFSTHDLELVKLADEFKKQVINYHFSEDAGSSSLSFDYKLKPGPVQSTNAIQILTREGLFNSDLNN
ncbi:MAG: DNA mismatch repair protein MutS, partial [Calditrichaeota bacterium]|nr:DNA mismatch repair protein MutS [Calditrichota bacterium]